jgi:protein involved in polysaccharide export with SLBB domain
MLARPVVIASVQQKRGRLFNIIGAVRQPGLYPIGDPDLRLLDAIGQAGDADANSRKCYVIRRSGGTAAGASTPGPAAEPGPEGLVIPPPAEEDVKSPGGGLSTAAGVRWQESGAAQPPTKEELADILTPPSTQSRPATRTAPKGAEPAFPPIIFDPQTGQVMEAEPRPAVRPAAPREPEPAAPPKENYEKPFDWNEVAEVPLEQRVILIDLTELRAGNPRYNIVVRDRDVIHVPIDTGVFYLMGEIIRPGVYAFGGREITIKQALAISGGFTPLAWPQRCDLIRREPGTDKQFTRTVDLDAIFAGLDDDFYLRDDDVVNVGTHFVAPFLYVIRNSFRFTYGFGFVYDRNFADKDAYGGRTNPEVLREARRQSRGLPF